jgi:hypothetical protein
MPTASESPSFKKIIEDKLGLKSFGIGNLRQVEWGRRYLWAVRFTEPKPPAPFDTFFPASDITIPEFSVDSFNFDQGQSSFRVPQRTQIREISMTFYDDSNGTLFNWFKSWINVDILNDGKYVSCLMDEHAPERPVYGQTRVFPIRTIEVQKLDAGLEPVAGGIKVYTVYPEGTIEFVGGSASEANTYTVTFNVVGEADPTISKVAPDKFKAAVNKGVQLLGRFF